MIQQFIHTIAKEEIAKLTVEEFKGRIITILSKEEADKAVEYLLRFPIVGFDTETRPSFKKGQRYKISLMQISTDDTCFLFRLNHIGIPESLEKFLKSSSTLKIGKLEASGSCWTSNLPLNSSIMPPLPSCSTKASCFSAVPSVSG